MSYKSKPILKLYKYENSQFILQAQIDDFQEISFERNLYQAGTFTISINYNIPNALLFERGMFVQFGNDPYDFGEIITITDTIGADGKGSQIRTITGYDSRYILKRRVIKNMNSNGLWNMTAKGELCLRNLIKDQCGSGAESKRQLPIINTIPASADAIGKEYSVSEQFTNLYEVCKTIATQSEIGWRLAFDGTSLTLECYEGTDRSQTVQFSTSFDSLANGEFSDSSESFSNAIYVGGKGDNEERDIYEGENGTPSGLDRFESFDNQSSMTTESEYEAEALSMLTQYGQTIQMSGNGLAKCPYIYKEQYDVGDLITVAFSGKSAVVQILSVTEHWTWGNYNIQFSFGKPQNNLSEQLQLMLRKIQSASNKEKATESVRWYNVANVNSMSASDVTFNTIGFTGTLTANKTFTFYLDDEKTGAKSYNIYVKNLSGNYNLTLTTGRSGKTNYVLKGGVNLTGRILVDDEGNITSQSVTATSVIESGNNQPATSGGVYEDSFLLRENLNSNIDSYPIDGVRVYRVTGKNIGWLSNDGFIINIPWVNATYGAQIAVDDQSNWLAIRTKSQGTWSDWDKILLNKINYSTTSRDIDTLYPSENGRLEIYGGNFVGNVPIPRETAILKTFRVSAINSSEVQIYQEWEAYGNSSENYEPFKYFRFGYYTGDIAPTWTAWQKVIRNTDLNPSWIDTGILSSSLGSIKYKKIGSLVALNITSTNGSLKFTENGGMMKKVIEGVETIIYLPEEIRPTTLAVNFPLIDNTFDTIFHARITSNGAITAWNNTLKYVQDVNSWNLSIVYSI